MSRTRPVYDTVRRLMWPNGSQTYVNVVDVLECTVLRHKARVLVAKSRQESSRLSDDLQPSQAFGRGKILRALHIENISGLGFRSSAPVSALLLGGTCLWIGDEEELSSPVLFGNVLKLLGAELSDERLVGNVSAEGHPDGRSP